MGVLLLLSQERWQKFVSFGFDHIISGFCYLIRQKFKLTSFSIACLEVSCTVWSGFWQFFSGRKKGKLCSGSVGGRRGNHLPGALGLHLLSRKDPRIQSSHSPGEAAAQWQVDLGQCQPWALDGWRRSSGIYFCVQGPQVPHSWSRTCQTEQGPPLHVSLKHATFLDNGWKAMPTGHTFLSVCPQSLTAGKASWLPERGNPSMSTFRWLWQRSVSLLIGFRENIAFI